MFTEYKDGDKVRIVKGSSADLQGKVLEITARDISGNCNHEYRIRTENGNFTYVVGENLEYVKPPTVQDIFNEAHSLIKSQQAIIEAANKRIEEIKADALAKIANIL